jgi:putative transposase
MLRLFIVFNSFPYHFITLSIVGWVDLFTRQECRDIMIESFKYCQKNKGLVINAYVIMSNHIHMIIRANENSDGLSAIIRDMKKHTSKELLKWVRESNKESRKEWLEVVFKYHAKYNSNNKNYQIWQQNNQPKVCLHPKFIAQKIDYIHNNPVAAGIVDRPEDYLYSSARNYLDIEHAILKVSVLDFGVEEGFVMT